MVGIIEIEIGIGIGIGIEEIWGLDTRNFRMAAMLSPVGERGY